MVAAVVVATVEQRIINLVTTEARLAEGVESVFHNQVEQECLNKDLMAEHLQTHREHSEQAEAEAVRPQTEQTGQAIKAATVEMDLLTYFVQVQTKLVQVVEAVEHRLNLVRAEQVARAEERMAATQLPQHHRQLSILAEAVEVGRNNLELLVIEVERAALD
jgi:hypothetical protein